MKKKERSLGWKVGFAIGSVLLAVVSIGVIVGTGFILVVSPGLGFIGICVFTGCVIVGGCLLRLGSAVEELADRFADPEVN